MALPPGVPVALAAAVVGAAVMGAAAWRARHEGPDLDPFLAPIEPSPREAELAVPLATRLLGSLASRIASRIERFLPRQYLDEIDHQLALAGLAAHRRAGDQLATQIALAAAGLAAAALILPLGVTTTLRMALVLLPVVGWLYPSAKLKRRIRERSEAIFKDLPDVIDMLAIAVEAGSGFEAALSLVCEHFDSPLTDELGIALHEMELGLPRREALQELKRRTDLEVVRTFVVALLQADALGVPIGRVLKGQATEVRARRRAWAREKAGKLPVKILFPLVLFIFPPILVLVLGPAMGSITKIGG